MSLSNYAKSLVKSELIGLTGAQAEGLRLQKQIVGELEAENRQLRAEIDRLQQEVKKREEAAKAGMKAEQLLRMPIEEIAQRNRYFHAIYEEEMMALTRWMVSQKAFKELAIQYGYKEGLTLDDVIAKGNAMKLDVLANKHNQEHGSNASDIPLIARKADELREMLLKKTG